MNIHYFKAKKSFISHLFWLKINPLPWWPCWKNCLRVTQHLFLASKLYVKTFILSSTILSHITS